MTLRTALHILACLLFWSLLFYFGLPALDYELLKGSNQWKP